MQFTNVDIAAWLALYLWPLFRIAALVSVAPIFGGQNVPVRIRAALSLAITLVIAPVLPPMPAVDPLSSTGLVIAIQQILIGLTMGFALRLVFAAFVLAGQLIGQTMGLGFASMIDPQNGVQVPVVSQFYLILTTLIFLSLNGHLILLEVLATSFKTLPIGEHGITANGLWSITLWGGQVFSGAILVSLPAMTALLIVNIAFGVMTRASPQLNIFAIGFPVMILLGIIIMMMTLPVLLPQLTSMVNETFILIHNQILVGK
jgi:flagellar biosynthesis protein FliR